MKDFLTIIWEWSEVWATIIPLTIFFIKKPKEKNLQPVIAYLVIAFFLNTFSDIIWKFKDDMPVILQGKNNLLYNIHSICRLMLFIVFFKLVEGTNSKRRFHWLMYISAILIIVNFKFFGEFFKLDSPLFTLEAIVLLVLCILYFLQLLKSEKVNAQFDPFLIIITGLAIYESASFFIFLFFDELVLRNTPFAAILWKVHNAFYLIFCIFIARAFYGKFKY